MEFFTQIRLVERKNPDSVLLSGMVQRDQPPSLSIIHQSCSSLAPPWKDSRCFANSVVHRLPVLPARDPSEVLVCDSLA